VPPVQSVQVVTASAAELINKPMKTNPRILVLIAGRLLLTSIPGALLPQTTSSKIRATTAIT
jgi:hypothetical protein